METLQVNQSRLWLLAAILLMSLSLLPAVYAQRPISNPNCSNRVTVWDNDSLSSIAQARNLSLTDLAAKNGLPTNAQLFIGDVLCLDGVGAAAAPTATASPSPVATTQPNVGTGGATTPVATATPSTPTATTQPNVGTGGATTPSATATPSTPAPATGGASPAVTVNFQRGQTGIPSGYSVYTVQVGDNLFKISQSNGADFNTLVSANRITNISLIYVGETLLIPPRTVPGTIPPAGGGTLPPTGAPNPGTGGPTTPAQPPATGGVFVPAPNTIPTLSLQPTSARPGSSITVSGANYPGNAQVTIYLEKKSEGLKSAAITTVTTQPNGTFSVSITIPATWSNGAAVNQNTVSVSAYTATGGYWAMNFFVNR
jgi:LysM repeat protein